MHSARCDVSNGGSHYLKDPAGEDAVPNILQVSLEFDGSSTMASGNVTQAWLADYDEAASVVGRLLRTSTRPTVNFLLLHASVRV